jgi:hypothetical protein
MIASLVESGRGARELRRRGLGLSAGRRGVCAVQKRGRRAGVTQSHTGRSGGGRATQVRSRGAKVLLVLNRVTYTTEKDECEASRRGGRDAAVAYRFCCCGGSSGRAGRRLLRHELFRHIRNGLTDHSTLVNGANRRLRTTHTHTHTHTQAHRHVRVKQGVGRFD